MKITRRTAMGVLAGTVLAGRVRVSSGAGQTPDLQMPDKQPSQHAVTLKITGAI